MFMSLGSLPVALLLGSLSAPATSIPTPVSQAYLGQPLPGDKPVPFAPSLLAPEGEFVGNAALTPDGREFYFSVTNGTWNAFELRYVRLLDGKWTTPVKPAFAEMPVSLEPVLTKNGRRIYFTGGTWKDLDIWFCDRTGEGWGKPQRVGEAAGAKGMKMFSSVSNRGTLVFGMQDATGGRIYRAVAKAGGWEQAVPLETAFNLPGQMGDPFLSPDEDYLIFQSERPGGHGQADLYISFVKADGSWTAPENLGPEINSGEFEFGPALSPDGKHFFFSRRKAWKTDVPSQIYWMKADFIEQQRKKALNP